MGIALLALLAPASAAAHLRSGTVAVDYKASISRPDTAAYSAQIFQSDRALRLTISPGHAVELIGYLGEPVFRLDGAGLSVNLASPTAVVLKLVNKSQHVVSAVPRWRLEAGKKSVIWPDSRSQGLSAGVTKGIWSVPLVVDGRRTQLQGVLERFPSPPVWPWALVAVIVFVAGMLTVLLRGGVLAVPAAVGLGLGAGAVSVVLVLAFSFGSYASPGTWIEAFDAIAFVAVGLWLVIRGPHQLRMGGVIGLGLVGLTVGLLQGAVFFHPIVLAILPAVATRVLAALAIGAGPSAVVLASLELL